MKSLVYRLVFSSTEESFVNSCLVLVVFNQAPSIYSITSLPSLWDSSES